MQDLNENLMTYYPSFTLFSEAWPVDQSKSATLLLAPATVRLHQATVRSLPPTGRHILAEQTFSDAFFVLSTEKY